MYKWWIAGKLLGFDENLCKVGMMLVTAVANSTGLERQFSTMRVTIYGDLRQSLGVDTLFNASAAVVSSSKSIYNRK